MAEGGWTREVGRDDHGWPQEPRLASSSLNTHVDTYVHTFTFTLHFTGFLGLAGRNRTGRG